MTTSHPPTRAEIERRFVALLSGTQNRDEISRWAGHWELDDQTVIEDEPVKLALRRLHGIDIIDHTDDNWLHPDAQVEEWLDDFRRTCGGDGGIPDDTTVTLWRPTGPEELELVAESGWQRWPPRLPGQPIFYPVLNEEYATQIARDWNVPASGTGHVTRFRVRREFLDEYDVHQVGGKTHREYWIPADELDDLNVNIVGQIELVATFTDERASGR